MTEKEKTAPVVSVGADTEQSILKQTNNSITDLKRNYNEFYIKDGCQWYWKLPEEKEASNF